MAVTTTKTNKPLNPRGNDQSPKGYNRAELYSGKALDFDGVNDVVNVTTNDLDFGANDFSVSAIVDWSGSHTDGKLAYAERGSSGSALAAWQIRTDGSGNMLFQANTAAEGWQAVTFSGVETIIADGLTHLTFVRVGTGATLYINGQFYSTGTGSIQATLDTPNGAFVIGNRIGSSNYWNGKITQYKIFSGALTAAQVADLYNNPEKIVPTGVAESNLKLWLPMMEGAGTTAYDGSGNGNHGTISGATFVHGIGAPVAQTAVIDWNKGTNLLPQSNAFSTSPWLSFLTLTSGQAGHDGTNNAWKIEKDASSEYIYQNTSIPAAGIFSVYAKAGTLNWVRLLVNGSSNGFYYFDLENGVVGSGSAAIAGYIDDVGNGWYRCSLSFNLPTVTRVRIYPADGDNDISGTSGNIYIQDAQAINGSSVGPYIPTLATAQTSEVLLPAGLTTGRDITGVNLFENVRKQGALNLDGNSWAEVHDNASLDFGSGSWTLEAWVDFDDSNQKGILSRWYGSARAALLYKRTDRISLYSGQSSGTGDFELINSGSISNGWKHIVGTYDSSDTKLRIYLDGSLNATSASFANAYNSNTNPLEIGRHNDSSLNSYTNDIAQPRIYNRALTAEEISRNYTAGKYTYTND